MAVFSFMPQLLYLWGKRLLCPFSGRLCGPHSQSECFGEEENLLLLPSIEP